MIYSFNIFNNNHSKYVPKLIDKSYGLDLIKKLFKDQFNCQLTEDNGLFIQTTKDQFVKCFSNYNQLIGTLDKKSIYVKVVCNEAIINKKNLYIKNDIYWNYLNNKSINGIKYFCYVDLIKFNAYIVSSKDLNKIKFENDNYKILLKHCQYFQLKTDIETILSGCEIEYKLADQQQYIEIEKENNL